MTIGKMLVLSRAGDRSPRACELADLIGDVVVAVAATVVVLTTRARVRRSASTLRPAPRPNGVRRVRLVTVVPDDEGLLLGYTDEPPPASLPMAGLHSAEIVGTVLLRIDPSTRSAMKMLDRWQRHEVTLVLLPSPYDELVEIRQSTTAPAILVSQVKAP